MIGLGLVRDWLGPDDGLADAGNIEGVFHPTLKKLLLNKEIKKSIYQINFKIKCVSKLPTKI